MVINRIYNALLIGLIFTFLVSSNLMAQRGFWRKKSSRTTTTQEATSDSTEKVQSGRTIKSGRTSKKGRTIKSGRSTSSGRKTTSGRASSSSNSRGSNQSARLFDMGDGITSVDLIGAWEITDACIFESSFEGDGLCATGDDIQEYVNNINVLVKNDGTGFLDVEGDREELTWVEDANGFQVEIGDDDFGQFNIGDDGELTIADDFGSGCYSDDDEEIEGIESETACADASGTWDEAASMILVFSKIADGQFDTETGGRVVSSSRRRGGGGAFRAARRRAQKAARRAAASARRAAVARAQRAAEAARQLAIVRAAEAEARRVAAAAAEAARVAEAAAEAAVAEAERLAKIALAELEPIAEALAKEIVKERTSELQAALDLIEPALSCMASSEVFVTMGAQIAAKESPDIMLFSEFLNECDVVGEIAGIVNDAGLKSFFVGVSVGANYPGGNGAAATITFSISLKDLITIWDDLIDFKEPSITPSMAIHTMIGRTWSTDFDGGVEAVGVIGWGTDEPEESYGTYWELEIDGTLNAANVGVSSSVTTPVFNIEKMTVEGIRYLGSGFVMGAQSAAGEITGTIQIGHCCITHINTGTFRCD
jgi:hypothetical protein